MKDMAGIVAQPRHGQSGREIRPAHQESQDDSSDLTTAPCSLRDSEQRCERRTISETHGGASAISNPPWGHLRSIPERPGQRLHRGAVSPHDPNGRTTTVGGVSAPKTKTIAMRWFREALRDRARRTLIHHEGVLRRGLMTHARHTRMDLSPSFADAMLAEIAESRGPAARNHCRNQCSQIWRWAQRMELYVGPNPWSGAGRAATPKKRAPIEDDCSRKVAEVCWQSFRGEGAVSPVFAAYFLLLLYTAMRRSEGTHLRWAEIDWDSPLIALRYHKTKRRMGEKLIPISPPCLDLLLQIRKRDWSTVHVFPSSGRCVSHSGHIVDPTRPWAKVREAAGCPRSTLHDLRRGFARMMHASGSDIKTVAGMLGHVSIKTTEDYLGTASIKLVRAGAVNVAKGMGR